MAVVNKFNVNKQEVALNADIIENMSANDVSYDSSTQYDENTVGDKLSKLEYDVTANNDGETFASLSELLSSKNLSALIPTSVRHGGMSIRFVQSSDNKYVQYFLTKNVWSANERDWEKMTFEEVVSQLGQNVYKTLSSISEINLSGSSLPRSINVDISSVKTKGVEINVEIKDVTTCLYDLYLINPNNQNDFVVIERDVNTAEYTYKYDDDGTHTEFRIYLRKAVGASLLLIFVPVGIVGIENDITGIANDINAISKIQKTELYNPDKRNYYFIISGAYTKNDCEIRVNSGVNISYDLYWFDVDNPDEYTSISVGCTKDFVKIPFTSPYTHPGIHIYFNRKDYTFESVSVAYTSTAQYILDTIYDVEAHTAEDINELAQKINKFEQRVELGSLNNGYIDINGTVVSSQIYKYTNPILFNLDTQIRITYIGTMMAVASITDKEGSVYTPIIIDTDEYAISKKTQYLDIAANSYVSFCGRWIYGAFIEVVEFDSLTRAFNEEVKFQVEENNKFINEELNIVSGSSYFYTKPIPIKRGETVWVYIKGGLCTSIASAQVDGTLEKALVYNNSTNGETFKNFYYSAQTDMYIVVCGKYYNQTLIKVGRDCAIAKLEDSISKLEDSLFRKFHSGIYIYPFRAIVGKRVMLYKDSIASGLKPSNVYQVDCVRGDNMQNYSWNALSFLPETAGE